MAVRPIIVVPHKALGNKAREIKNIDDAIVSLALDMAETMYKAPGIGLAANQVGELVRMVVVDVEFPCADPKDQKRNPIYLLNPVICQCEGENVLEEACLSVPDLGVEIARPACIQVKAVDLDGNEILLDADGILARALQHEIDHLNGTTILEHASVIKRNMYKRKLKKKSRRDD
jgi:peptide deformylase